MKGGKSWQRRKAKKAVGAKSVKKVIESFTSKPKKQTVREQLEEVFSEVGDQLLCQHPGCPNQVAEGQNAVCKDHIRRS